MKIAFVGYGQVGGPLADHLQRAGHSVTLAAHGVGSDALQKLRTRNPELRTTDPAAAVHGADVVFLATPFAAVESAVAPVAAALRGKILIDCTNPVGPGLTHGLGSRHSGTEQLQRMLPETRVVKAFSIYGFENFEDHAWVVSAVKPAMMFCGNDPEAKAVVARLISDLGWEPLDVGPVEQALHLEHMTLLWIRMVRAGGYSPRLLWAALRG